MQYNPQRSRADGAFVAIDPFRPSVSLGIKNIIGGQNDPTIDDIPVTRPQPYTIRYEGQPYVQPGTYLAQPYSQPIYTTQPHSQPIYQPRPHTQPISQAVHPYPYPPNFRPPYPTQPTVILPQPPVVVSRPPVVPVPVIIPSEGSSSESRRGHEQRRHPRRRRRSQSRSPRRSSIRSRSRSPRRHSTERHYSKSPQRRWLTRLWRGRMHRAHTGPHQPRHQHRSPERAGVVDSVPSASEVRGRPRSPKPLGCKNSDETGSSSEGDSSRSVSRSPPLACILPSQPVATPFNLPVSPRRSPSPAREQRPGSPRFSPTSPRFSPMSSHSSISPHHPRTSPRHPATSTIYPPASSFEPPAPPPASQGSTRSTIPSLPAESLSSASRSRSRSPRRPLEVDHVHPQPTSGSRRSRSPQFLDRPTTVIMQPPTVHPAGRRKSRSQSYDRRRSRSSSPSRRARKHSRSPQSRSHRRSPQADHVHPRRTSGSRRSCSPPFLSMPPTVIMQPLVVHPAGGRKSRSSSPSRRARKHSRSSQSRSPRRPPQADHVRPRRTSGSRRSRSPQFLRMLPTVIMQPPVVHPAGRRKSRSQSYHRRRSLSSSPSRRARKHSRSRSRDEWGLPRRRYSWDEWRLPRDVRGDRKRPPPVVILPERESRRPHWDSRSPPRQDRSPSSSSSPRRRRRRRSRSPPILVSANTYDSGPFIPPYSGPHTPKYARPTMDGYEPQPYAAPYIAYVPPPMVRPPLAEEKDNEEYYLRYAVHPRITAYATAFLLDTVPRQIYLHCMFRLPSLYFSRVTRIFEEAEMSMPEIKKMALEAASGWPAKDLNRGFIFEPQELTPPYASLQSSWQSFIDSLMREWKTLNIISVLLLSCVYILLITAFIDSTLVQRHFDDFAN